MYLKSRISQVSITSLAFLVALAILALAWPRLQAAIRFLPVEQAIDAYQQSQEIPSHRMVTLIGFANEAIAHHDHYSFHDGLSFLYYLRGLDIHTPALERRPAYRQAEAQAIETVKRAPAQPEAWLRIATTRAILRDEPEMVIAPWKMSVFTGRTHSTLLLPRVDLGLSYLGYLDAESRSMLKDQLLLAWELEPRALLRALKVSEPRLEAVRELLGGANPAVLMEMEAGIEKVR